MIERRPFEKLGGARHDWLDTKHHFSFADYFLGNPDLRRSGLLMTPFGPRVLSPIAAREAIDNIRRHWGEDAEPQSDEHLLSLVAAIDQPSGPAPYISVSRRGQFSEALSWVRRHGVPIGESLRKFLDRGGVYLNVSQFPPGIDPWRLLFSVLQCILSVAEGVFGRALGLVGRT